MAKFPLETNSVNRILRTMRLGGIIIQNDELATVYRLHWCHAFHLTARTRLSKFNWAISYSPSACRSNWRIQLIDLRWMVQESRRWSSRLRFNSDKRVLVCVEERIEFNNSGRINVTFIVSLPGRQSIKRLDISDNDECPLRLQYLMGFDIYIRRRRVAFPCGAITSGKHRELIIINALPREHASSRGCLYFAAHTLSTKLNWSTCLVCGIVVMKVAVGWISFAVIDRLQQDLCRYYAIKWYSKQCNGGATWRG